MNPMHTNESRDTAWHTYLENENDLLREHYGEYAWIVGNDIRAICADRIDLCKKIVETSDGQPGFTVKIEKSTPPIFEVPSPTL